MATPPGANGNNVKRIWADVDDRLADAVQDLLTAMRVSFEGDGDRAEKHIAAALGELHTASRMVTLLRSGQISEADAVMMGVSPRRNAR